jgi:hypothetical protein
MLGSRSAWTEAYWALCMYEQTRQLAGGPYLDRNMAELLACFETYLFVYLFYLKKFYLFI